MQQYKWLVNACCSLTGCESKASAGGVHGLVAVRGGRLTVCAASCRDVGDNEMKAGQVSLRVRDGSQQNNIPLAEFAARAKDQIARRAKEL